MSIKRGLQHTFQPILKQETRYLVIGNSHPECALNDSLCPKMSNWGRSGEALYYSVMKAKKIIEDNPQIKLVCIELSVNQLDAHMDDWIYDSEHMERAFKSYGFLMSISEQGDLFRRHPIDFLQSSILSDKKSVSALLLSQTSDTEELEWGGFAGRSLSKLDSLLAVRSPCQGEIALDPVEENLIAVKRFITFANERGVKIVLVRCPVYFQGERCWESSYHSILSNHFSNIDFIDFQDWEGSKDEFFDLEHLNIKGANRFSPYFDSVIVNKYGL